MDQGDMIEKRTPSIVGSCYWAKWRIVCGPGEDRNVRMRAQWKEERIMIELHGEIIEPAGKSRLGPKGLTGCLAANPSTCERSPPSSNSYSRGGRHLECPLEIGTDTHTHIRPTFGRQSYNHDIRPTSSTNGESVLL